MPIYLDHNSTTPVRPEVRAHWLALLEQPGRNASSLHAGGRAARNLLDEARERAAACLDVAEDELLFTSGGTESNNLAILGALRARASETGPCELVTTAIEHSSVLQAGEQARREGHTVTHVHVDDEGLPDPEELAERARRATLVSVSAANNEIGTCPPLPALGDALREGAAYFHTDAAQALGRVPLHLRDWGVDLATFSAHKFGGPPGVGVLYRRRGVALQPLMFGGGQEHDLRPGTENVAAISACAFAMELAQREIAAHRVHLHHLARTLWDELRESFPHARLLGPLLAHNVNVTARLPGTLSVLLPNLDGRVLVTRLDLAGLQVSAGSACASGSLEPSHVLLALGLDEDRARAALRISVGRDTTLVDVRNAVEIMRRTLL